jgi:hypothetical protein
MKAIRIAIACSVFLAAGASARRRSPATEAAGTFRELRGTASFSWDLPDLRPGMMFYAVPTKPERTRRSDATLSK